LQPLNVVFPEVGAPLDFDENQDLGIDVFDSVCGSDRDVNRPPGDNDGFTAIQCDFCPSGDDDPMLRTAGMFLVAQPFTGQDIDALNLIIFTIIQDRKTSPWTFLTHAARIYQSAD